MITRRALVAIAIGTAEAMMIQRMTDNDKIVTRYMDDKEFGEAAFTVLSKAIYDSIPAGEQGPS